jgi:hypothetical protein
MKAKRGYGALFESKVSLRVFRYARRVNIALAVGTARRSIDRERRGSIFSVHAIRRLWVCVDAGTKRGRMEETHMKASGITCTAIVALLFGVAVQATCLPQRDVERKDQAKDDQSGRTQPQSRQRPAPEPRQSNLSSQPLLQAKPLPPAKSPQQQDQRADRGQQERTNLPQPGPDKQRDQPGAYRQQRPDTGNQSGQHPQDSDKNRSRLPFDQQHGRKGGDNRDGRDHGRPGDHLDNRRDYHNDWQGRRAHDWRSDHRTWEQRGGYRGYRIPEYRFGRYFGPGHFFRIHNLPVRVSSGFPSFLYGGYWFSLVDVWPEYWAENWYETDDVYIAYTGDGYYLFNRRFPGAGVAVSISM